MERVVKGLGGLYTKEKENKPATNVILTVEEYESLLNDIKKAENQTQQVLKKANIQVNDCRLESENKIKIEKENALKRVKTVQNELDEANKEIYRLNDLNANLLRMAKERANAKRGLKPKKTHHGYMVLDSQQHTHIFKWNDRNGKTIATETMPCWKVRIQSPYDSSIPYETIIKNIYEDLRNVIGSALGIKSYKNNINRYTSEDIQKFWKDDKNFIFKTTYKANIKSGFWEVEYLVKSSITIPEDMRTS